MKRRAVLIMLILILSVLPWAVFSAAADDVTPVLTMEDVSIEYTPQGYTPQAFADVESLNDEIQYLAVDVETSAPVSLPLVNAGEYRVKAYITGADGSETASVSSSVVITPVTVTVAVEYLTVAYTSEAVEPSYKILPEWAADYINIKASYTYFGEDGDGNFFSESVTAPCNLGTYLTLMDDTGDNKNFCFAGKAYIFTVAERRGKKQSEAMAAQAVDPTIYCEIDNADITYSGYTNAVTYKCYPECLKPQIEYRQIDYSSDSGASSPTTVPPTEPGEYTVTASLFDTVLATGTMVINKIVPELSLSKTEYQYTPNGVFPTVHDVSVPCSFIAYSVNEDGSTGNRTALPLTSLGTYLIVINPVDTDHYESVYALNYITVVKATAVITTATQSFVYDGFENAISYNVDPSWAECEVRYYTLNADGEIKTQLGTQPPINVGKYMATIYVKDTENVELTSVSVYFSILRAQNVPKDAESTDPDFTFIGIASPYFIAFMLVLPAMLIIAFIFYIIRVKKK